MAWTSPFTFADNDVLRASDLNAMLRDNMNETAVGKATTPRHYFVNAQSGDIVERRSFSAESNGKVTTSSTSFVDLGGPQINSIPMDGTLLVIFGARLYTDTGASMVSVAPAFSNDGRATWSTPDIDTALRTETDSTDLFRGSSFTAYVSSAPETVSVRLEYISGSGTGYFAQRDLHVIAF